MNPFISAAAFPTLRCTIRHLLFLFPLICLHVLQQCSCQFFGRLMTWFEYARLFTLSNDTQIVTKMHNSCFLCNSSFVFISMVLKCQNLTGFPQIYKKQGNHSGSLHFNSALYDAGKLMMQKDITFVFSVDAYGKSNFTISHNIAE